MPQAVFDAVFGFAHDETLYLATLFALSVSVNNSDCVPLTPDLLDLDAIDFAQQHYLAHFLHIMTHPSSQMLHRRPTYLHLTALHATFFHSPKFLLVARNSLQDRSFTACPKMPSKFVQCYHQIVFRCVPSFLHFVCSETSLL